MSVPLIQFPSEDEDEDKVSPLPKSFGKAPSVRTALSLDPYQKTEGNNNVNNNNNNNHQHYGNGFGIAKTTHEKASSALPSNPNPQEGMKRPPAATTATATAATMEEEGGLVAPEAPSVPPKQDIFCPNNGKLKILICSGNMGNAAPNPDGMSAWIPYDGQFANMKPDENSPFYDLGVPFPHNDDGDDGGEYSSGVYDSMSDGRTEFAVAPRSKSSSSGHAFGSASFSDDDSSRRLFDDSAEAGHFDIIVVAMQESTFSRSGSQPNLSTHGDPDTLDDEFALDPSISSRRSVARAVAGKAADIAVRPVGEVGRGIERTVVAPLITAVGSKDHNKKGWFGLMSKITKRKKKKKKRNQRGTSVPTALSSPSTKYNNVSTPTLDDTISQPRGMLLEEIGHYQPSSSSRSLGNVSIPDDATTATAGSRINVDELPGAAAAATATLVRGALKPVLNHPTEWTGGTQRIHQMLEHLCPSYSFPVRYQRGEMRLIIMVRDEIEDEVKGVRVVGENTGIGSVLANKGGIVASMNIRKTKLTFLAAHLEAHEGRFANRCNNILEILSGTRDTSSGVGYDVTMSSHHMFICGDLNFRVKHNQSDVRKLIANEDWGTLNEYDELQEGLTNGDLLLGFKTLPCLFPPTFKLMRKNGFIYKDQRTPSYTDRILWKSAHGFTGNVQPLVYEPVQNFSTSDHKPVRGAFTLETNWMPPEVTIRRKTPHPRGRKGSSRSMLRTKSHSWSNGSAKSYSSDRGREDLYILVKNMSCKDLPKTKNVFMKTDPYIMFVTDPRELLRQKRSKWEKLINKLGLRNYKKARRNDGTTERMQNGWPRTRKFADELNPDWGTDEVRLKFRNPSDFYSKLDLTGAMLYLTVMDFDHGKSDKIVGTVALNLKKLSERAKGFSRSGKKEHKIREMATTVDIDEPLLRNGQKQGTLRCQLVLWRIRDQDERESLSRRFSKGVLVPRSRGRRDTHKK